MRKTPSIAQHCVSTRQDGAPCTAQAGASGYCIGHDPGALEGRVTLDGAELELCQECKAPVHYYDPDGAPYCETHGPGL